MTDVIIYRCLYCGTKSNTNYVKCDVCGSACKRELVSGNPVTVDSTKKTRERVMRESVEIVMGVLNKKPNPQVYDKYAKVTPVTVGEVISEALRVARFIQGESNAD